MIYILSNETELDIQEILDYTKLYFPQNAISLHNKFENTFDQLTVTPNIGSKKPNITKKDLSFYLMDKYWIIYQIKNDNIYIVRVLNTRQNITEILSE